MGDEVDRFLNQSSPILDRLRAMSHDWQRRFTEANGTQPDAVLYPLMARTSDIRYSEIIGEQRAATRFRWVARKAFAEHGLKWVSP